MAKRIKITTVKYRKKVNRPPLRVSRPISTVEPADSTLKIRTEHYEQLGVATSGHTYFLKASGAVFSYNYINVYDLIANSPSYDKYKGLFGKMRIESLKLLCYSVKSPSSDGLATQLIAFFPNFTSSSSLIETLPANDDSLPLNYNSTRPHVRTYKFKKVIILVLKVLDMVLILILKNTIFAWSNFCSSCFSSSICSPI